MLPYHRNIYTAVNTNSHVLSVLSASLHPLKEAPLIVMHTDKPQHFYYLWNTTAARVAREKGKDVKLRTSQVNTRRLNKGRETARKSHRKWLHTATKEV